MCVSVYPHTPGASAKENLGCPLPDGRRIWEGSVILIFTLPRAVELSIEGGGVALSTYYDWVSRNAGQQRKDVVKLPALYRIRIE